LHEIYNGLPPKGENFLFARQENIKTEAAGFLLITIEPQYDISTDLYYLSNGRQKDFAKRSQVLEALLIQTTRAVAPKN
jgi:hypothetical protein